MDSHGTASLAPRGAAQLGAYHTRLAHCAADLRAAQTLRFKVFNLELHEGLAESYLSGADADPFDAVCDHLVLEDTASGALVGTYRMLTGPRALQGIGCYSQREFDFAPYAAMRADMLELGRACIAREHRNFSALSSLWRGIVAYAQSHEQRYLVGCSSLTTQDSALAWAAYRQMAPHLVAAPLRTRPCAGFECPQPPPKPGGLPEAKLPKLLSAYLALGAQICGPPAIDREFKTVDFLTLLDLHPTSSGAAHRLARFGVVGKLR